MNTHTASDDLGRPGRWANLPMSDMAVGVGVL